LIFPTSIVIFLDSLILSAKLIFHPMLKKSPDKRRGKSPRF